MFLKKSKPYTPSMRHTILVDKRFLGNNVINKLKKKKKNSSGRNKEGHITVRRKKGRKIRWNLIDYKRNLNINIPSYVQYLLYDSSRSSFIALICSKNGVFSNIISSKGLFVGSIVYNRNEFKGLVSEGDHMSLKDIPFGMFFFNVNQIIHSGFNISRAAGTKCLFINKLEEMNKGLVRIPSGKKIFLDLSVKATIGISSNIKHKFQSIGKAGRSMKNGKRPSVRGVAMNPVDHPHGGGEGKKSGRVCPFSPWRKQPFFKKVK